MGYRLHLGDCLEGLRRLESDSAESCVTDPPASISFMGKKWDSDKGGRAQWCGWLSERMTEVFRVLKPGGHCLVWAIPRRSHWTALALEDSGFEVRDIVCHLFGTGYPKSHDVSKAIDKAAGAVREVVGTKTTRMPGGNTYAQDDWTQAHRAAHQVALTTPATDAAKQWEGWGTALKPAVENWILCRKPLAGSVAATVIEHGAGAINIDGCRAGERWPSNLVCSAPELLGDKAQFFYCPKASKRERNEGLDGLPLKANRVNAPRGSEAEKFSATHHNHHPTCKPIALCRWLCRLVTPPGGLVVDPFAGSCSVGCAALAEGFRYWGAEAESEYADIALARLEHWSSDQPVKLKA